MALWPDRVVLREDVVDVWDEVFDHRHVRQRIDPRIAFDLVYFLMQASHSVPSMFIAQDPQMPSRHERRKVSVGSISFLILLNASNTIGPQALRSIRNVFEPGVLPVVGVPAID